ncbi:type IV pilus assembly protein PilM [Candidatus Microgenomates bacterium]|nr:MAG: type IV pilus assembly protein PilM [Candidatus Microgenomates bacterium]
MSVGLDIGTKSIKVVELNQDGNKFSLKSAGAVGYVGAPIEPNLQDEKEIAALGSIIKKLMQDAKVTGKDVSISLPESQVFTRMLKFPMLTDQEISSAVKWEAEEYIPIPLKEAIVEHSILDRLESSNPPQVVVLLIAVLKTLVEKYVEVVNAAGLNVISVETELLSMVRSLAVPEKTIMVVDFGAKSTDIAVARNMQLYFSRSIPTAGDAFSRAVGQALGVNMQQAEQYKRAYGLSEGQLEGKVGRAIAPILKVVSEEIKKASHYYQMEVKADPVEMVMLAGGSAGIPGMAPMLSNLLNIEVTIGSPFTRVTVDPTSASSLANYAPLYSVAVGLAMRKE